MSGNVLIFPAVSFPEIAAQYDVWHLENLSYPLPTEGTMAWITVNRCDDYR